MSGGGGGGEAEFDEYAEDYDAALAQGLSVSGEGRDYFAHGRLAFLARCLREDDRPARKVMDFGCGTGAAVPLMRAALVPVPEVIVGVDPSPRSIARANRSHAAPGVTFAVNQDHVPTGDFDLAYCNGVFHHIPVAERPGAVAFIRAVLRPGGVFAFWENNPWSPGARYVMSKIPFDRDAVMVSAGGARALLTAHGFRVLRTDYLFIFPAALRALRPLEDRLRWAPAGAQYQVLAAKI
jgi:SAM-dependent methyltransferase